MVLTVCFFEPVIQVSESRALHGLLTLVVGHLLFNLLVRCVILTVGETSLWNSNAISHWNLAVEPLIHLIISL